MLKGFLLIFIRFYQKTLSPDTGFLAYKHPNGYCRFYPHCSEYAYQAIDRYGSVKGSFLAAKRVVKCNPFNKGGIDQLI